MSYWRRPVSKYYQAFPRFRVKPGMTNSGVVQRSHALNSPETMIIQLRPLDYKSEHPGNNKKMMYIPVLGRDIVLNVTRYINNTGFFFQLLNLHFQSFVFLYFSLKEVVCSFCLFL